MRNLIIRGDARRNEPTMHDVNSAVIAATEGLAQFQDRASQRITQIEAEITEQQNALNVLNETVQLGGLSPASILPGRNGISDQTLEAIRSVLLGTASSLPQMALTIGTDSAGGYTVVADLESLIVSAPRQQSAMRRLARTFELPFGVGSLQTVVSTRGATGAWASEIQTRAETTNPQLAQREITPYEYYFYIPMSAFLADDNGVGLVEWLQDEVVDGFQEGEGAAFINGTGTPQPNGILTAAVSSELDDSVRPFNTVAYVPTGADGAFASTAASSTSSPADVLVDLVNALNARYRANAAFVMSSQTAGTLRKVKDQDGRFIWQDSLQAGQPAMLLGYPVEIDENMPEIADDSLSIMFGDFFRAYTIVDRPGIRLISDPFTRPGMINSYWFRRVGGGMTDSRAVKFLRFSAT